MKTESVRALHLNRAAPDDRAVIDGHDAESFRARLHAADAHRNTAWNLARESVLRRRASVAIPHFNRVDLLWHRLDRGAEHDRGRDAASLAESRRGCIRFDADRIAHEYRRRLLRECD